MTASLLLKADNLTTYSKEQTDLKISAVVGLAPATLNTIKRLALAINNDDKFSTTITTLVGKKATATEVAASLALKTDKTLYDALVTAVGLRSVATEVATALTGVDTILTDVYTTLQSKSNNLNPQFVGHVGIGMITGRCQMMNQHRVHC